MAITITTQMAARSLKLENSSLVLFFILFAGMYHLVPLIVYVFLLPLFYYLYHVEEISWKWIIVGLVVVSLIDLRFFRPYGYEFMSYVVIVHLLFWIPFIWFCSKVIRERSSMYLVPAFFFILAYLFGWSFLNNFWVNLSGFLFQFPISVPLIGSLATAALIVCFQVALFRLVFMKEKHLKKIAEYSVFVMLFLLFFISPLFSDFLIPISDSESTVSIVGVQGNLRQDWNQRIENNELNFNFYMNLSRQAIEKHHPDIIIWPEYTLAKSLEVYTVFQQDIRELALKEDVTFIIGSYRFADLESQDSLRYNTLFILNGTTMSTYDAYEPVALNDPNVIRAESNVLPELKGHSIGLLLCYEEQFTYVAAKQTDELGASVFLSSGNQYYIADELGLEMIARNAALRAAENQRYLFRLVNSGKSAVYDYFGREVGSIPMNEVGFIYAEVPLIKKKSFYTSYKNEIEITLLLLSLLPVLPLVWRTVVRNRS